jgi:hypothetical protein
LEIKEAVSDGRPVIRISPDRISIFTGRWEERELPKHNGVL